MGKSFCPFLQKQMLLHPSLYPLDVISLPKAGENFCLLYDTKGRFHVHDIRDEEAKVCMYVSFLFNWSCSFASYAYVYYGIFDIKVRLSSHYFAPVWLYC
jgi:hypothetical protein